jgi:hypothetical protein
MTAFTVTVRRPGQLPGEGSTFPAIGTSAAAVIMAAIDEYGVCIVSARPIAAVK